MALERPQPRRAGQRRGVWGGRLLKDQTVGVVMRVGFSGPHACGAALLHLHPARLRPVALTLDNIQAKKGMLNVLGDVGRREIEMGSAGGSLEPPGPLTHLHTVYMAYSECLPTRLNPLAERTCFSQVGSALYFQTAVKGKKKTSGPAPGV